MSLGREYKVKNGMASRGSQGMSITARHLPTILGLPAARAHEAHHPVI